MNALQGRTGPTHGAAVYCRFDWATVAVTAVLCRFVRPFMRMRRGYRWLPSKPTNGEYCAIAMFGRKLWSTSPSRRCVHSQ